MIKTAFSTGFDDLLPALKEWIATSEHEISLNYRSRPRRQQYLAGRGLLRWLVCQQWGYSASVVTITQQNNGAPLLRVKGQPWQCSISHTKGAALVAVSPKHIVGVDIERIKPRKHLAGLLSQSSNGFFAKLAPDHWGCFYQRWTLAEAVTKAEQGLLLATIRSPSLEYRKQAIHTQYGEYMLCCYSPVKNLQLRFQLVIAGPDGKLTITS